MSTQTPAEPDDGPTIEVDSNIVSGAQTLVSASLRLLLVTGKIGDEPMLVPFVECEFDNQIEDADGNTTTDQITSLLSIDNLAYLLDEVSSEFDRITPLLASMATGVIRMPPRLLQFSIERLVKAEENLASVRRQLALIEAVPPPSQSGPGS
jgi:hypothetical protein